MSAEKVQTTGLNTLNPNHTENQQSQLEASQLEKKYENLLNMVNRTREDEEEAITNSLPYKVHVQSLESQSLHGNVMFEKLKNRLIKFYVAKEQYRLNGLTKQQEVQI